MLARLATAALVGLTAYPVGVEVDIGRGLPAVTVVGLGGTAVLEARDRLRAAFGNTGYEWPDRRITVSLPPADLPKQGSGFDLAKVKLSHAKMRPGHEAASGRGGRHLLPDQPGPGRRRPRGRTPGGRLPRSWPTGSAGRSSPSTPTTTCAPTRGKPRPGYQTLLADLRAGRVDAVICLAHRPAAPLARPSSRSTSPSASPATSRPRPSRPARSTWPPPRAGWSPAARRRRPLRGRAHGRTPAARPASRPPPTAAGAAAAGPSGTRPTA